MLPDRLIPLTISFTLAFGAAFAEDASVPTFDRLFDMPEVEAVEFSRDGNDFFAVADNEIWHWALEPLRLVQRNPVDGLISDLAFSRSGLLVAVGQRWNPDTLRLLGAYAVGFEIPAEPREWRGYEFYALRERDAQKDVPVNRGIAQFSAVGFDDESILIVSPVDTAVTVVRDGPVQLGAAQNIPVVTLGCGASLQLSVTEFDGRTRYFSSTANRGVLEFGLVSNSLPESQRGECLDVTGFKRDYGGKLLGNYPVSHALIDRPSGTSSEPQRGVLVLEPNTDMLYLFEIDSFGDEMFLTRTSSVDTSLPGIRTGEGKYTMLAATPDGSEILVSGTASTNVLRYRLTDDLTLESRGSYSFEDPVRRLEISHDGRRAVIVTGASFSGGDQEIIIVSQPSAVAAGGSVPVVLPNVQTLQRALNNAGYSVGAADGILGPRTRNAVTEFVEKGAVDEAAGSEIVPLIRGLFPAQLK